MADSDLQLARLAFQVNRSGPPEQTVDAALALAHPQTEFSSRLSEVTGAPYRGHDGVRRYFEDMADAWREWHNEVHSAVEAAPGLVLVEFTFHAVGRAGGAEVELRHAAVVVVRDGRVHRLHVAPTVDDALSAARLA